MFNFSKNMMAHKDKARLICNLTSIEQNSQMEIRDNHEDWENERSGREQKISGTT